MDNVHIFKHRCSITSVASKSRAHVERFGATIFNNKLGRNDCKRKQCEVSTQDKHVKEFIGTVQRAVQKEMETLGWWVKDNHYFSDPNILRSLPGCQEQEAHRDFEVKDDTEEATLPAGVIVALEPDTTLEVWDDDGTNQQTVKLYRGDVLIFRGSVVHAGSAYDKDNVRIHLYVDSRAQPRQQNKTWNVKTSPLRRSKRLRRTVVEETLA